MHVCTYQVPVPQQYIQQYVPVSCDLRYVLCTAVWYCFWLLLLFVSHEYSTGSSVLLKYIIWYEYAYFGTINTYQVCESAAVCVCILLLELLLLLLLLLFVIVHLPPEVFFIQQQYLPSVFIAINSCTSKRPLPLKAFVRPRLYLLLHHTSLHQYGHARSRRRASARRGETPLVVVV